MITLDLLNDIDLLKDDLLSYFNIGTCFEI